MSRFLKSVVIFISIFISFLAFGFWYFGSGKIETFTGDDQALSDSESSANDYIYDKENTNIIVNSPKKGTVITYPLKLIGRARVFENQFNYRLSAVNGEILAEGYGMTTAPDIGLFGPYAVEIFYKLPTKREAILSVFQYSMMDGSEDDLVTIPVFFSDVSSQKVNIFLNPADEPSNSCYKIAPVERLVPKTQRIARAAIEELLRGPLPEEIGLVSLIPQGTQVTRLTIERGVAKIDFNYALDQIDDTCIVTLVKLQIEETLKQFPSVDSVVISVNGNPAFPLQP